MTKKLEWLLMPEDYEERAPEYVPREVNVPRCQSCGRFASTLYPVYAGSYYPEILFEVGKCCKMPQAQ